MDILGNGIYDNRDHGVILNGGASICDNDIISNDMCGLLVQTTSFEEKDGTTKITTDSKVIGKSILSRAMFAIMEKLGGSFTAQEAENIENLKKVIEENTTDYYPTI